ncbi:MAG: immunoglobulin-like domain-containing protein [Patescibacteria group bacterium]|jgi:hypothetical protein
MKKIILLSSLLFIFGFSSVQASTYTVTSTADAGGLCDGTTCTTLRAAISAANANAGDDIITLSQGVYELSIPGSGENSNATGDFDITQSDTSLTINGVSADTTIISVSSNTDRIFNVTSNTSSLYLNDMTLTGGYSTDGGAIDCVGNLYIDDSNISSNSAINTDARGGGIYFQSRGAKTADATLHITDSLISNNIANGDDSNAWGGGLYIWLESTTNNMDVVLQNVTISGNEVDSSGDARELGAGVFMSDTSTGNTDLTANFRNVTVSDNTLDGTDAAGGGIYISDEDATLSIRNSILDNNSLNNCFENSSGGINSYGYNIDSASSCGFGGTGDLNSTDPLLETLADNGGATNTRALQVTPTLSPAINIIPAASCLDYNSSALTVDQRGFTRPDDSYCDVGAFEADQTNPVITVNNNTDAYNILECASSAYTEYGATVTDNGDNFFSALTADASGSVDTNIVGSYAITYASTDHSYNTATANRTVTVTDTTDPTITLIGEATQTVDFNSVYTDPGATFSDACDTATTVVTATGTVNTGIPGTYTITYTAVDASGNLAASQTRTVAVVAEGSYISSVAGTTNGDILITYSSGQTEIINVFDYTTTKNTKISQHENQYYIALAANGKKVALVDIVNKSVLSTKTLSKNVKYTKNTLKLKNIRNKDAVVIVSKKNSKILLSLLKINAGHTALSKKDQEQISNKNIKPKKTTIKKSTIYLKNKNNKVLQKYLVTKKYQLKAKS